MVNPGAFGASRKVFLMSQKPDYSAGVMGRYAADALALIQRKYLKRFPIDLQHNEEPTEEWLASVNDDGPDPVPPDIESLGEEDYNAAMKELEERQKLLAFRKAVSEFLVCLVCPEGLSNFKQIKRWLAYQYMKDHDIDPRESGAHNPYRILLHKLTGSSTQKPRQKAPVNVWRKLERKGIDLEAKKMIERDNIPPSKYAAVRDKVAREMFNLLSPEEKAQWVEQAKEEHEAAMAKWKNDMEGDTSTAPEDRQRRVSSIFHSNPITDLV